jgi:hypothetical protein
VTQGDYDAFCQVVVGFAELKGKQLSAPAIELYWHAMKHWPLDAFRAAAEQLLRTSQFMPTPKDFQDLLRAGEHTAGEAWDAVYLGRGVVTERARRAAEIASNGRRLAMLDIEREVPHVQRRFIEIYNELTDVEQAREVLPALESVPTARVRNDGLKRLGGPKKPQ